MVPATAEELKKYLKEMHENRSHVKTVKVNTNGHLEIDLDGMANFAGYPDMYMPIKKGKIREATDLVERMMRQSSAGFLPSDTDANALFDMIDQHAG
jgi:hypothetical protein